MLLEFYGAECPHCLRMMPIVDKLVAEGIKIEKKETWHNETHAKEMEKYDRGFCGGVPFFFNTDSKEWICGGTDEKTLRAWAAGEKVKK